MADYVIAIADLEGIDLSEMNPQIVKAARMAINKTADRARARSAKEMRRQVNFPASYIQGQDSRLTVSNYASDDALRAVITGRKRPTSLARFVTGSTAGRGGVRVQVKPGRTHLIKRGFLMKLRTGDEGALGNMGLAVRTERGKRPERAYKPVKIADGLWLLYGPSVDQVFKSVRQDIAPDTESFLAREFTRLLDLKL